MASLLRKLSHHDVKQKSTLVRSKTYESDLTKLEKRLPVRYKFRRCSFLL